MGALHPSLAKTLDVPAALFLVELHLSAVIAGKVTAFTSLSKYPELRRDLALVVADSVTAGDVEYAIASVVGELLRHVNTFDVYAGKGIDEGHKSLAVSLTLQHPSRTLRDDEVNELVDRVVSRLQQDFAACLRH